MASSPINSWQIDGKTVETVSDFIFLGSKITADGDCSHEIKRCLKRRKVMTNLDSILKSTLTPWKKNYDQLRQHIKKQRHNFDDKSLYSQSYGFSSSHVWMLELDHKES